MRLVRPVMADVEAEAARTVLQAVLDKRLLVEHDEERIHHAVEAIVAAQGADRRKATRARGVSQLRAPKPGTQRYHVLRAITGRYPEGLTAAEAAQVTQIRGCWRRVSELEKGGWIRRTDEKRKNEMFGGPGHVYLATDAALLWADGRTDSHAAVDAVHGAMQQIAAR